MEIIVAVSICIIIFIIQQRIYRRYWDKGLDVDIFFDRPFVRTGETACITEVISNAKRLPLTAFHVKFKTSRTFIFSDTENSNITDYYHRNDVFSVQAYQKITRRLPFHTSKRGYYGISGVNIVAMDFFMSKRFAAVKENDSYFYVFPSRRYVEELSAVFSKVYGELPVRYGIVEDPYMFGGIREYTTSDSMRRINWKSSAKTGELMVNIYHYSSEQKIKILINYETNNMIKPEYLNEMCIEMAGSTAEYFIDRKLPVSVSANAPDCITGEIEETDYGATSEHMVFIDKYLARLGKDEGLDSFFQILDKEISNMDKSITYIIFSPYYKDDLLIKLDYLAENGISVHMITPYFDISGFENVRSYIHGMEVAFNET